MRAYVATVTSNGQLTLPAAIRRELRIGPGDRVAIVIDEDNGASLRRVNHDIASVRGSRDSVGFASE